MLVRALRRAEIFEVVRDQETLNVTITPREKGAVEGEEFALERFDFTVTAINQFDVIADRDFSGTFFLKLALTFTVPFCVSVTSSTLAALRPIRRGAASE